MTTSTSLTAEQQRGYEAAGEAALNAALSRLPPAEREAYWASVRRCYNAPYNDAVPKAARAAAPDALAS